MATKEEQQIEALLNQKALELACRELNGGRTGTILK
jgi:hypothetical protein